MQIALKKTNIAKHIFTELNQNVGKTFWLGYLKKADDFKISKNLVYNCGRFDLRFYKDTFGKHRRWKKSDGTMYITKGNKPTVSKEKHLHLFNLIKKSPRYIAYDRVLWWGIKKQITMVDRVETDDLHIALFENVPFKMKKELLKAKPNPIHWNKYYVKYNRREN